MSELQLCAVIPSYNNPDTIRAVVETVLSYIPEVIVVDDGGGPRARQVLDALAAEEKIDLVRRAQNGGKGAAVKDGLLRAQGRGFSHALQVDADGQHTLEDIPKLIAAARERPEALVLAAPVFDATAPKSRLKARQITVFWCNLETGGPVIEDPMCGFRVYPVQAAVKAKAWGNYMDFDPEIAVRLVWAGHPVTNVPTKVRYVSKEEGGVSHFRMFQDNVLISWMHTRLMTSAVFRGLFGLLGRLWGRSTKKVPDA